MITAKEASKLYNENLLLRDKYIEEVIEPLIKENATMSKSVSLPVVGRINSKASIYFTIPYAQDDEVNVKLTEEILKTLRENGYKVDIVCSSGTERFDGQGELTISWD